jgi:hypothetical protein
MLILLYENNIIVKLVNISVKLVNVSVKLLGNVGFFFFYFFFFVVSLLSALLLDGHTYVASEENYCLPHNAYFERTAILS